MDGTLVTRIQRINADFIASNPSDPPHQRSILAFTKAHDRLPVFEKQSNCNLEKVVVESS
jgi:hypothetical protein